MRETAATCASKHRTAFPANAKIQFTQWVSTAALAWLTEHHAPLSTTLPEVRTRITSPLVSILKFPVTNKKIEGRRFHIRTSQQGGKTGLLPRARVGFNMTGNAWNKRTPQTTTSRATNSATGRHKRGQGEVSSEQCPDAVTPATHTYLRYTLNDNSHAHDQRSKPYTTTAVTPLHSNARSTTGTTTGGVIRINGSFKTR